MALLGIGAAVLAALAILPTIAPRDGAPATSTTALIPALAERPPFGTPLRGALAYLGANRTMNLVDLATGRVLGSKGVASDERPAAAATAGMIVGNLPAGGLDGNWDAWRRLPWDGTIATDLARGEGIAHSGRHDALAAAMRPLPSGANGVLIVRDGETWEAASSAGRWGFPTWIGDEVLVREERGSEVRFWALDATAPAPPRPVELPAGLRPIAGTSGLVMGELDGDGVIADLTTGEVSRLTGGWSWGAEWRPGEPPMLATVGGEPGALVAYNRDGSFAWSWPVGDSITPFRGGVSWAPDGSFVVAVGGGTLWAFTDFGGTIGTLDRSLPDAQVGESSGFVAVVAAPSS